MYEAYPLQWPDGYKRHSGNRYQSRFKQTMDQAQRFLRDEISRLGGSNLIVSTNLPIRQDGHLYADWMRKKIEDPGVAIYFKYSGKPISMCCDRFPTVWENIYSLGKGIEALRGMERWGVSSFLDRVFTGFTALPPSGTIQKRDIWEVLNLTQKPSSVETVKAHYYQLAKRLHPDAGGTVEAFHELQEAYQAALKLY